MEIKVIEAKKNPLLKRQGIKFRIKHDAGTPKRNDVKDKLAAMLNTKPELVIIERMRSEFGKRETLGYAKIYKSKKHLKRIERPHIVERNISKVEEAVKEEGEKAPEEVKTGKEEKVKEGAKKPKESLREVKHDQQAL